MFDSWSTYGIFWAGGVDSYERARYLLFNHKSVSPRNDGLKTNGFSVRYANLNVDRMAIGSIVIIFGINTVIFERKVSCEDCRICFIRLDNSICSLAHICAMISTYIS